MPTTMRVRKGDLVQILSGKDRGKQGRVIEARPRERRVVVENLNLVKRHTRPKPVKDSSRMGGPSIIPGGVIDKPAARSEEHTSELQSPCNPVCRLRLEKKKQRRLVDSAPSPRSRGHFGSWTGLGHLGCPHPAGTPTRPTPTADCRCSSA